MWREASQPRQISVRTTAYTHTEAGGAKNAIGTRLRFGSDVSSAATDWSWIPVGTRFRLKETGRIYVVEDYGSALVGKQTIDLYLPNEPMMRAWGVRQVNIEILEWGSMAMSRMLLQPRRGTSYINRMLLSMDVLERGLKSSL
jgi:3D (Asp-Asp-Asp) domain-containing protein